MDDLLSRFGRARWLLLRAQQFNTADPASLSLDHACVCHILPSHRSSRTSPTHENASRLFFSQSYSFASSPPPLLLPPSSVLPFRPFYKVSSRFNPKDTSHGKYSLIATFRCVVLVFFCAVIYLRDSSCFSEQTFALR